jgi:hypothetical protein
LKVVTNKDGSNSKEQKIKILSKEILFGANESPNGTHGVMMISENGRSLKDCRTLRTWAEQKFGHPNVEVDTSYTQDLEVKGNTMRYTHQKAQWNLGTTIAMYGCIGIESAREPKDDEPLYTGILAFGAKGASPDLKPVFSLKCTQTLSIANRQNEQTGDLVIKVNENEDHILYSNNVPYPGKVTISENSIDYKETEKSRPQFSFHISRSTGSFGGIMRNGGAVGDINGTCVKTKSDEPKKF